VGREFVALGLKPALMPAFGEGGGAFTYISALPTILFNYGSVATLPSWLNETPKRWSSGDPKKI
jgi:hypothetical protein